jgi:ubiquinone/menaquinone biosynthesis C-methylase UbiE
MEIIGESSAVSIEGRQLGQHQAALTVMQRLLSAPGIDRFTWLDLACGRGQILSGLGNSLSPAARAKIDFFAYDVKEDYLRETRRVASALGFSNVADEVGALSKLEVLLPAGTRFDFITLTNTVHEVAPSQLAGVLVDAVLRLNHHGTVFVYDMERVKPPELGAVPFSAHDFRAVSDALIETLTNNDYRPEVSGWKHSTVNGWNVQFQREHIIGTEHELETRRTMATEATKGAIFRVLRQRLVDCRRTLEVLTTNGADTAEEQEEREHLLHELWAITRALGADA